MGLQISYGDVSELRADLARDGGAVGAKVSAVVRRTARAIERDAKALVPIGDDGYLDGFLHDSIGTSFEGDGRFSSMTAEIEATARYAGYVEYGTSDTAPQPFMRQAFDGNIEGFERAIADAGESIL